MKASLPRAAKPSLPASARTIESLALFVSIGALFYFWTLNYNKLGSFYDYSILADGAGKIGAGLRPFRDFSSPLQSLPIWIARVCELIFGPRYLALAYGNLVLTLILFFVVLHYAKKHFSYFLALSIAMAVTVASSLQHGIIWYNSIALLLLSAISLKCADLLRLQNIRKRDVIQVAVLLLLIGMTKINFTAAAIGTVAFFGLEGVAMHLGSTHENLNKKQLTALFAIFAACCVAPPFLEVFANRTTFPTWLREVVLTPASRAGGLSFLANPAFYLLEWNRFYPGTLLNGSVLFCLLVYGFIAFAAIKEFREVRRTEKRGDFKGLIIRLAILCLFWGSTCLLVLTNVEIESLCLCYCLIGVIAMRISSQFSGQKCEKALQTSSMVLAIYFLLVGGVSMARHSRISYHGNDFAHTTLPAAAGPAYLRGVVLSHQAAMRLAAVNEVVKDNRGIPVYWGPGLEMMNRIYSGVVDPTFPLWYHIHVSVRDADAQPLIEAIARSGAGLVVADAAEWREGFPDKLKVYLDQSWDTQEQYAPLMVYKRRAR
jgi:hypothetical protein